LRLVTPLWRLVAWRHHYKPLQIAKQARRLCHVVPYGLIIYAISSGHMQNFTSFLINCKFVVLNCSWPVAHLD